MDLNLNDEMDVGQSPSTNNETGRSPIINEIAPTTTAPTTRSRSSSGRGSIRRHPYFRRRDSSNTIGSCSPVITPTGMDEFIHNNVALGDDDILSITVGSVDDIVDPDGTESPPPTTTIPTMPTTEVGGGSGRARSATLGSVDVVDRVITRGRSGRSRAASADFGGGGGGFEEA
ncbi:hypothetical protein HDU76_009733 [Blyttiomyces sp. JEL0837]|nr:hypothetical protein HDU76_009733 [Blyttiomyces sp. JEL0837]